MKCRLILLLITLFVFTLNAQSWIQQTSNTSDNLRNGYFIDANTGWVVGEGGTVLNTTDGGEHWTVKSVISDSPYLIDCFFLNSSTGWACGDGGIFKTVNGGSTWTKQSGPSDVTKIHFMDASHGWVAGGTDGTTPTVGKIYTTTDGGEHWAGKSDNTTWSRFYGLQFIDGNTGWAFAASNGLLIKTTNGGQDWQTQMSYGTNYSIQSMYFVDQNTGFVGGNDGSTGSLNKTADGGANWVNKTPNLQYGPVYIKFFDSQNGISAGLGRSGEMAILSTTDGGENWSINQTTFPEGINGKIFNGGYFFDKNTGWAFGDGGVILRYQSEGTAVASGSNPAPKNFSLEQNYPNPFNPSTVIRYSVGVESMVSIKLYDVLGKEINTLVNRYVQAGSYSVYFNGSNLKSGIYFYELKAVPVNGKNNAFTQARKLMLIK